ncbi:hypothetical protein [Microbacterium halophytorum]|uniref:hypothetical protein n=1 Tax=Microbacterium halophytorum TaxID=2067568 RepID=UPI000CFCA6F5|nr:hypothetical protein [Microbacterium halophytorum]
MSAARDLTSPINEGGEITRRGPVNESGPLRVLTGIPDDVDTRLAIADAEADIARTSGSYADRDDAMRAQGEMAGYAVLKGDTLATARRWSLREALIRDALPTLGELLAKRRVVAA